MYLLLIRILNDRKKWLRILLLLIIPIPFGIYFIINPIYEGDFSNNSRSEKGNYSELKSDRLTVLTIPGCPYCYESIADLKRIKERTGVDSIDFLVVTGESSNLDWYKEEANDQLNIQMISSESELVALARGTFPTFVYTDGEEVTIWDNSGFGVIAKDWIEEKVTK